MPRAPRLQDAGYVHHVISRGNDRQVLFKEERDYHTYLEILNDARRLYPLNIYNYVLMSNHLHLLVEPKQEGALSKVMEHVSKSYARYFNQTYGHTGHVFQGRFKSFVIQEERYFFYCSRYIDLNPIRANMVSELRDYEYQGFKTLGYGEDNFLKLNYHSLYIDLGKTDQERQIGYRALVNMMQPQDIDLLNRRAGILGDAEFKDKIRGIR